MKKRFFRIRVPYEKGKKALEITEKYDTLQEAYFDREVYAQENRYRKFGVITRIRICGSM